jgi:hypothetical protein
MPLLSNVAVHHTAEGDFMPDNYTIVDITYADAQEPKLRALAAYLRAAVPDPFDLYPRHSMDDKYSRNKKFGFNLSSLADACIRKLLYDLDQDMATLTALKTIVAAYLDATPTARIQIALDDNAIAELEQILNHLTRLDIEVGRTSFKKVPNRKLPLNVAIEYCYRFILSKTN